MALLENLSEPRYRPESERREPDDMSVLETALLRRSLAGISADSERCGRCTRTLLIGERVYEYASSGIRCELCRLLEQRPHDDTHTVHGPEFGHTIRVLDRRRA